MEQPITEKGWQDKWENTSSVSKQNASFLPLITVNNTWLADIIIITVELLHVRARPWDRINQFVRKDQPVRERCHDNCAELKNKPVVNHN